jgi:hypothetical protein
LHRTAALLGTRAGPAPARYLSVTIRSPASVQTLDRIWINF